MLPFIRYKNLPFSTEDVRKVCSSCKICAELKPQFFHPSNGKRIKSTGPMERLSIDFKGPLPSASWNKYLVIVVDEYSRFPFAFPCPSPSAPCVMKCLDQTLPCAGQLSSYTLTEDLHLYPESLNPTFAEIGIATSKSSIYHPTGMVKLSAAMA